MKAGDVLDGRYRIDAPLAKGGMGAVYQATHLGTDRRVALKVINRDLVSSPVMLERFRREARAAGRLNHPHVVNVTDFGLGDLEGNAVAYLVMEYLHGRTLRDLLKERKQLPLELAVDITEQVALAVDAAHALGIVHRDLKPENIWLVPNGADRFHAKVLDFGIAKLREELEVAPAQLPPALMSSLGNGDDDIVVVGESAPRPVTFAAQGFAAVSPEAPTFTPPTRAPAGNALGLAQISMSGASMPSLPHDAPTIGGPSLPSLEHDAPTHTGASPDSGVSWKSVRTPSSSRSALSQSFLSTPGSAQLTEVGGILGTPYYMAPEQFRGDVVDERADIYALGVCIYQMLSGDVPHRGSVGQLVLVHTDRTPPPPMHGAVPKAVEDVVRRSLAWEPSSRPSSAGLVAAALKGAAEGEDVVRRRALALPMSELVMCAGVTVVPYLVPLTALVLAAQESTKLWYLAPVVVVVVAALSALSTIAVTVFLRDPSPEPRPAKARARDALRVTLSRLPKLPSAVAAVLSGNAIAPALFARDKTATPAQARALAAPVRQVLRALALRTWAAAIVVTCTIPFASLARALALDALQGSLRQGATPSPLLALVVALFGVLTALGPVLVGLALQLPVSLTAVELLDNARAIAGQNVERPLPSAKRTRPRTLYGFALAAVGVAAWLLVVTVGFEAAVLHDDSEAVAVLMNLGADPNPTATRQPLHDAAFAGKARVVDALLQGGANPNALDRLPGAGGGATPLIAAISAGSSECVRLLLQHGANPNLAAKNGETPLHEAVTRKSSSSRIQIVRMLLERGAAARTPGIDGKTPAELAAADGDEGLAKMFVGR